MKLIVINQLFSYWSFFFLVANGRHYGNRPAAMVDREMLRTQNPRISFQGRSATSSARNPRPAGFHLLSDPNLPPGKPSSARTAATGTGLNAPGICRPAGRRRARRARVRTLPDFPLAPPATAPRPPRCPRTAPHGPATTSGRCRGSRDGQ